tara:strand:+ start:321 stop:506 length:186 start_codon:yes stop_codon:yes gene_type:complete
MKNIIETTGSSNEYKKINPKSNGIFISGINFLLENLSTKKPEEKSVIIELIEYAIKDLGMT